MSDGTQYEPATVKVHDLIWVREREGWTFHKGSYRKLRLTPSRRASERPASR